MQVFPSEESLERLVGAAMSEQDEIWSESRYSRSTRCRSSTTKGAPRRRPPPEKSAAELMEEARKMILASLELAERVEAA